MKQFACNEEFEQYEVHLRHNHGFDSRLEAHYIIKLEGQIKALEQRLNRQGL